VAAFVSSTSAATFVVHVPVAHDLHCVVHPSAQHAPSTQCAETQSASAPHGWPFVFLHPPAPSHAFGAPQVPSVCPAATLVVQVPAAFAHDLQAVVQASWQQVPSRQKPDRQSPSAAQPWPGTFLHPPAPSQALPPLHVPGSATPLATRAHAPPAQVRHVSVHTALQHTPSTQWPDTQSVAPAQVCPSISRQTPAPSHRCEPLQAGLAFESGAPAATSVVQVPAALAHDRHGAVHALAQQVPSTQCPDRQSPSTPQPCPSTFLQAPAPSHAFPPLQAGLPFGSPSPAPTFVVHVPVALAHERHVVVHASAQHVPSTQFPEMQSAGCAQLWPSFRLHPPAPSHAWVPAQVPSSYPFAWFPHVPGCPERSHRWHVPPQASLQQKPSTQFPLKHSPAPLHRSPWTFLHAPAPSHCDPPPHAFVGYPSVCPTGRLVHTPTDPSTLHALQVAVQSLSQHFPSTQ
jgi:hypothetical protein